jgi:hypothetical protein
MMVNLAIQNRDLETEKLEAWVIDREQQSAEIAEYVNEGLQLQEKKSVLIQAEPNVLTAEIVRIQNAVGSVMDPEQKILIAVEH